MNTGNNYANMLSSYGFNDKDYFETYPEERRNWRKAIKQHVDDAMGIDDEQIKEGDNMTERLKNVTGVSDEDLANGNNLSKKLADSEERIEEAISDTETNVKGYVTLITGVTEQQARSGNTISKKIADVKETVDEINSHIGWNTQQNKTITTRLTEIKDNTASLLGKLPDTVYHNFL